MHHFCRSGDLNAAVWFIAVSSVAAAGVHPPRPVSAGVVIWPPLSSRQGQTSLLRENQASSVAGEVSKSYVVKVRGCIMNWKMSLILLPI